MKKKKSRESLEERFKGLANHVSRQGSVSGSVSGP